MNLKLNLLAVAVGLITSSSFAQDTAEELPITTIEFEESEYDFGHCDEGDIVSHVFRFTNSGEVPLIITKAKGSCGCTVPFFPKVPILPGESSEIEVEFNSKGKKNTQSKRVTVYGNIETGMAHVRITGDVLVSDQSELSEEKVTAIEKRNELEEQIEEFDSNCFAIFPNPTNETLQLELKEHIGKSAIVEIRNKRGKKVFETVIQSISRETTRFDVSSYRSGIYLISIIVDGGAPMTQCFVVANH